MTMKSKPMSKMSKSGPKRLKRALRGTQEFPVFSSTDDKLNMQSKLKKVEPMSGFDCIRGLINSRRNLG